MITIIILTILIILTPLATIALLTWHIDDNILERMTGRKPKDHQP